MSKNTVDQEIEEPSQTWPTRTRVFNNPTPSAWPAMVMKIKPARVVIAASNMKSLASVNGSVPTSSNIYISISFPYISYATEAPASLEPKYNRSSQLGSARIQNRQSIPDQLLNKLTTHNFSIKNTIVFCLDYLIISDYPHSIIIIISAGENASMIQFLMRLRVWKDQHTNNFGSRVCNERLPGKSQHPKSD